MTKSLSILILVTIALLALRSSYSYETVIHAHTNTTSSNSTTTAMSSTSTTSIPVSSTTTTSTAPLIIPSISLSPSSGLAGLTVLVSGSGFSTSDTACSISGRAVASQACSISGGALTATTAFIVANVAGGSYNVKVTGSPAEDFASTQFTVTASYSISFNPPYWLCTDIAVTFTGPLVESGYYGDTLQFQYFQYEETYPSDLVAIFTDTGLTVTSDTVNYWISAHEYAAVNFAFLPYLAVKVVDVTAKPNGYVPGLIFLQLTNISPESGPYCESNSSNPTPEFQTGWYTYIIMASVALSLVFLRVNARNRSPQKHRQRL